MAGVRLVVWTWTAIAVAVAFEWVAPLVLGSEAPSLWWLPPAVFLALVGLGGWQVRGGETRESLARELDVRFGLEDATATALAVEDGRISGPLATHVLQSADGAAARVLPQVPERFPVRVPTTMARRAVILAVIAGLILVGAVPLREVHVDGARPGSGAGPQGGGTREPGTALAPPSGPLGPEHGAGEGPAEARAPDADSAAETDEASPPDVEPDVPEQAGEPPVAARILTSKTRYRQGEPVVVVVTGTPNAALAEPVDARILLLLDDEPYDPGVVVRIDPDAPEGEARLIDLGRNPVVEEQLTPGTHTVSALLVVPGHEPIASNQEEFEIEGDDGGSESPESTPEGSPPPPAAEPPPPTPTGATPPPEPGASDEPGPGFPDEAEFDRRAVVPLFREDELVKKEGLRLVVRPSGGLPDPVRRAELAEVLPEARWRAEQAVDRGRIRPEDLDLVRRYFERLERLGR